MKKEDITKEKALINFARAKKSIAKTIKMVESNKPCVDIMRQNSATVSLLRQAYKMLIIENFKKNIINSKK